MHRPEASVRLRDHCWRFLPGSPTPEALGKVNLDIMLQKAGEYLSNSGKKRDRVGWRIVSLKGQLLVENNLVSEIDYVMFALLIALK